MSVYITFSFILAGSSFCDKSKLVNRSVYQMTSEPYEWAGLVIDVEEAANGLKLDNAPRRKQVSYPETWETQA